MSGCTVAVEVVGLDSVTGVDNALEVLGFDSETGVDKALDVLGLDNVTGVESADEVGFCVAAGEAVAVLAAVVVEVFD